jgi:hypothetical protein
MSAVPPAATPDAPAVIVTPRDGQQVVGVILKEMSPLAQAGVRGLRTYIQCLLGFLVSALASKPALESVGVIVPPSDFLPILVTSAGFALAPTVLAFGWNLVEILNQWDARFPKTRA